MDARMSVKGAVLSLVLLGSACAAHGSMSEPTEATLLRDWALSRCIAKAAKDSPMAGDAARTAAVFLERGSSEITKYEELEKLVDRFLAREYSGSVPGSYDTLKCIDMYHSRELTEAAIAQTEK